MGTYRPRHGGGGVEESSVQSSDYYFPQIPHWEKARLEGRGIRDDARANVDGGGAQRIRYWVTPMPWSFLKRKG